MKMFERANEENLKQLEMEKKKAQKEAEKSKIAAQKWKDISISPIKCCDTC